MGGTNSKNETTTNIDDILSAAETRKKQAEEVLKRVRVCQQSGECTFSATLSVKGEQLLYRCSQHEMNICVVCRESCHGTCDITGKGTSHGYCRCGEQQQSRCRGIPIEINKLLEAARSQMALLRDSVKVREEKLDSTPILALEHRDWKGGLVLHKKTKRLRLLVSTKAQYNRNASKQCLEMVSRVNDQLTQGFFVVNNKKRVEFFNTTSYKYLNMGDFFKKFPSFYGTSLAILDTYLESIVAVMNGASAKDAVPSQSVSSSQSNGDEPESHPKPKSVPISNPAPDNHVPRIIPIPIEEVKAPPVEYEKPLGAIAESLEKMNVHFVGETNKINIQNPCECPAEVYIHKPTDSAVEIRFEHPSEISDEKEMLAIEYIVRANFGLISGGFELRNKVFMYRANCVTDDLTDEAVADTVLPIYRVSKGTYDRYVPGLVKVMKGEQTPKEAVAVIEDKKSKLFLQKRKGHPRKVRVSEYNAFKEDKVNGIYQLEGISEGRPYFKHVEFERFYLYYLNGYWRINDDEHGGLFGTRYYDKVYCTAFRPDEIPYEWEHPTKVTLEEERDTVESDHVDPSPVQHPSPKLSPDASPNPDPRSPAPVHDYDDILIPSSEIVRSSTKLGEGGMGIVWLGTYADRKVALKTCPGRVMEFKKEIKLHQSINHPSVVRVFGTTSLKDNFGADQYYLVMQYCHNKSLLDLFLNMETKMILRQNPGFRLRLALEAAQGMAHIQSKGIIHFDVKPANFMVDESMHVMVADFGLSRMIRPELAGTVSKRHLRVYSKAPPGMTPLYAAPDFIRYNKVTQAYDVYSFSLVLYQLYTMQPPFYDLNPLAMPYLPIKVIEGERPSLPDDMAEGQKLLLGKCWDPDPEKRPSFNEIAKEIRKQGPSPEADVSVARVLRKSMKF